MNLLHPWCNSEAQPGKVPVLASVFNLAMTPASLSRGFVKTWHGQMPS
ncbi:MAG: hypothetical protein KA751_08875 [Comamonas sp.]|nr:hypothetical protein [Comamonas sp.]